MASREFRRKDLKEDEFVSTATRVTRWLMQRRRRIGWALLGLVLIGSLIAGVRMYQQRQEERAAGLLATAMEIYRSPVVGQESAEGTATGVATGEGVTGPADTAPGPAVEGGDSTSPELPAKEGAPATAPAATGPGPDSTTAMADEHAATGHRHFSSEEAKYGAAREALLPIVDKYGGTASGKVASFYLGICEAELGNVDAAVEHLEAAADSSRQLIASMALYRLGILQLDQGDPEAAAAHFERLVTMSGEFFPREQALMARGRAHEAAGDLRAALASYQQVVSDHGDSFSASNARERLEEISSRLGLDPDVEG